MIKLSASKVDCYMGCPRLYAFRYIERPFVPPENKYFVIGNVAHKALELFYQKKYHVVPDKFKDNLSECLKLALQKNDVVSKLKRNEICKKDIESIRLMMKNYLTHVLPKPTPNVLYIEKAFYINVDDINIAGKADRIDIKDDSYVIVDYKTNSKAFSKKEIEESVQLPTYKIWLDSLNKDKKMKVFGEYVYLKLTSGKKWTSTFEITDAAVKNAVDKYKWVCQELKNNTNFKRNLSYKYCGPMCDYFGLCQKGGD